MSVMRNSQQRRASICTYSGIEFFPLAPRSEDIYVEDLAHALALTTRYNGHCVQPYSIAQHCVLVSQHVSEIWGKFESSRSVDAEVTALDAARWGLLHDAAEAYISDICSPIKPFIVGYKDIEVQLEIAISHRFSLPWPMPSVVGYADKAVFRSEVNSGIMRRVDWWEMHPEHPNAGMAIIPWAHWEAKARFIRRFKELFGKEVYDATDRPRP